MTANRDLIIALTRYQLSSRFRGSFFSWFWMFLNPLLTIVLLSFVFGALLQVRWNIESTPAYPIVLFGGLIIHIFLAECVTRAPTLVSERPEYVHKIVFPLAVLGVVAVLEASVLFLASLILFLLVSWLFGFPPTISWLALPFALLPMLLYGLGITWLLGAIGPYLPDLRQLVGQAATALLLLSPVLYPLESVPAGLRPVYFLNPSTAVVQNVREIVFAGSIPGLFSLGLPILASLLTVLAGKTVFDRLRRGFADVV
jgi:lipopolysaccharide transport system permease protein